MMSAGAQAGPALAPAIVLVRPQLAENIGTAARAMLNCGLIDLRLVNPRCDFPDERAVRASSGADRVLAAARLFDSVEAAVADLSRVYATCPRDRDMVKPVLGPQAAIAAARDAIAGGGRAGFLFGAERTGLENDEVTLADAMVPFPVNPEFDSLNLAQAVLLIGWEWLRKDETPNPGRVRTGKSEPATKDEVAGFLLRLEAELDACGFLRNEKMRPTTVRNLRAFLLRARPTGQEIRTAHGMLTGLVERPHLPAGDRSKRARTDREG